MQQPIRVSGSNIGPEELSRVGTVFDRGYLGMGADVLEFEQRLTDHFQRPAVAVATGTAALQLALQGVGVGPGDEVILPSLTYVAAFQAVTANGASPIAVDITADSMTLDPLAVERSLSPRTKAIMPVYYGGGIANLDKIYDIARSHGLRVIEDAAHAFGSVSRGMPVGAEADVACFSFDPIKNLTCGDGGCVVTSDEEVLELVRDARLLGVQGDSKARAQESRLYEYSVDIQGWRYHMSNVSAAIGLAQLDRFEHFASTRKMLASVYDEIFHNGDCVETLPWNYSEVVPHIYVVRVRDRTLRDKIRNDLKSSLNVETALHWYPNHLLPRFSNQSASFAVTEDSFARMMTLPLHTRITEEDVSRIGQFVIERAA